MKKKLIAIITILFIGTMPFAANAEENSNDLVKEEKSNDNYL